MAVGTPALARRRVVETESMAISVRLVGNGAVVLVALVCGVAWADPPGPARLLVRPFSAPELVGRGVAPEGAAQRHAAAVARVSPRAVKRVDPVGLIVLTPPPGQDPGAYAESLRATGDYAYVEPDPVLDPITSPNDPLFGSQWHHQRIASPSAWARSVGARSVTIALVDTGVDLSHPDLAGALVPGFNSESMLAQGQGGDVSDVNGHGTATAGVAAGIGNNGVGVAGVAWNVNLMPIRATSRTSGGAYLSDILYGASWAAANGARVVSVSYEGCGYQAVQDLGWAMRWQNSLLVWGAGNSATRLTNNWTDVTIVSGTTAHDGLWPSSNFGPAIDLAAPAVNIVTTARGGGYASREGTSFAAPIVAGLAALVISANPTLNANQVEQRLIATATDLGPPGWDESFGHGLVNAGGALGGSPPAVTVAPDLVKGGRRSGVAARVYETGPLVRLPDLAQLAPDSTLELEALDVPTTTGPFGPSGLYDGFAASLTACVRVPVGGAYTLYLTSDDGSMLWIGGVRTIDHDGVHAASERSATVNLLSGWYSLRVDYFEVSGPATLRLEVAGPGLARQVLPASWASHDEPAGDLNGDDSVDFVDLLTFLTWYNSWNSRADLTGDEVIDFQDFLALLRYFS